MAKENDVLIFAGFGLWAVSVMAVAFALMGEED